MKNPPYTELGKSKPYKGYEYKFQMALVEAMRRRGFEPTYTPNDANLSKAECERLGRMGIRKGMPDLMLYRENIAIELKVNKRSISQEQNKTMAWLTECGWTCFVVWSFPAAMGLLDRINKGEFTLPKRGF